MLVTMSGFVGRVHCSNWETPSAWSAANLVMSWTLSREIASFMSKWRSCIIRRVGHNILAQLGFLLRVFCQVPVLLQQICQRTPLRLELVHQLLKTGDLGQHCRKWTCSPDVPTGLCLSPERQSRQHDLPPFSRGAAWTVLYGPFCEIPTLRDLDLHRAFACCFLGLSLLKKESLSASNACRNLATSFLASLASERSARWTRLVLGLRTYHCSFELHPHGTLLQTQRCQCCLEAPHLVGHLWMMRSLFLCGRRPRLTLMLLRSCSWPLCRRENLTPQDAHPLRAWFLSRIPSFPNVR